MNKQMSQILAQAKQPSVQKYLTTDSMIKKTNAADVVWQTPRFIPDLPDGVYDARCHLEMEPPIQDPIETNPSTAVRIKNGWVNASDAAEAIAEAVQEVGGAYDAIVGLAFVRGKIQFIVVWEHTSPKELSTNPIH